MDDAKITAHYGRYYILKSKPKHTERNSRWVRQHNPIRAQFRLENISERIWCCILAMKNAEFFQVFLKTIFLNIKAAVFAVLKLF